MKNKLEQFKLASYRVSYGISAPYNEKIYDIVRQFISVIEKENLEKQSNIFLGHDGEVRVCIYANKFHMEFTVETDLSITYFKDVYLGTIECIENIDITSAFNKIRQFNNIGITI